MACERGPKLVTSLVIPAMLAVPGFPDERTMLPATGKGPPSTACIWRPLRVSESMALLPLTVSVTVRLEVATEILAAVMLLPDAKDTLPTPALNLHPTGALKISVLLVPVAKSALKGLTGSAITMFPSVVKAGTAPFSALSAETFAPPEAAVTLTFARAPDAQSNNKVATENRAVLVISMIVSNLRIVSMGGYRAGARTRVQAKPAMGH